MIVSFKDAFKLIGVIIVAFCAVFVCTFFLNFYLDAQSLESLIDNEHTRVLYDAQMATALFTCAISGGFLALIAVVMIVFYIKLYVDKHSSDLGVLKAMGYSEVKIALRFCVFGLSVLLGTALGFGCGFAIMPTVYKGLAIEGLPEIAITFHPALLFLLVFLPAAVFAAISVFYAYFALRRPAYELMRGRERKIKLSKRIKPEKERSFLKETCLKTLFGKKSLAFFVAFACFCFSAMVQMSASMESLVPNGEMGWIIFAIGVVLAVTSMFMAITSLVNGNVKNIAMMKAFGYSMKESAITILGGYHLFAATGFALGTVYQYGLLSLMINVVFKDVAEVPEYNFSVPAFFITLAAFIVLYEALMLFYAFKINKVSVKTVMLEN
ncbi:MAG: ABC transporter permease [Clostridia bacterium]|nr:ABC transporter permease [Clostridia bacterium]